MDAEKCSHHSPYLQRNTQRIHLKKKNSAHSLKNLYARASMDDAKTVPDQNVHLHITLKLRMHRLYLLPFVVVSFYSIIGNAYFKS